MSQEGFGFDAGEPDHDRLREFDADFTPGPIVFQALVRLSGWRRPMTILDPSAGAGVFGQQCRLIWPDAKIWGVEPRQEERNHLMRHYDFILIQKFQPLEVFGSPDLIITNPPFPLFPGFIEAAHTLQPRTNEGRPKGLVLLGLSTWGQSAEGVELFERFTPYMQLRIGGRIGYRGPGLNPLTQKPWGVDQRDYSWWVWDTSGPPTDHWMTFQLPVLSVADRTWKVRPGTEDA